MEDEDYDDIGDGTEDIATLVCFEKLSDSFLHFFLFDALIIVVKNITAVDCARNVIIKVTCFPCS